MRKRLFEIIETGRDDDVLSQAYDWFMMAAIVASIVPLNFHSGGRWLDVIDKVTVVVFIADYILRLATADLKLKKGAASFVAYPFSFMALVDLISILPSLTLLNAGFKTLKILRLFRTLKVFKVFKAFRYSKSVGIIVEVFRRERESLSVVGCFAIAYVYVTALVMFNAEPETFDSMFKAVYWATVSLTTMGYGDIYATSTAGQVVTMLSALVGIAIVALPAGIITAGYMKVVEQYKHKGNGEGKEEKTDGV